MVARIGRNRRLKFASQMDSFHSSRGKMVKVILILHFHPIYKLFNSFFGLKRLFLSILMYFWSKMGFTFTSCAATGLLRSFDGETSCILYFFGLGKYTKKSLWSHLLALF